MRTFSLLLITLLLSPFFTSAQYAPRLLALTHATIIDADHPTPTGHQTVLIRDGHITDIQSGDPSIPDSAVIIDLRDKFLIPGLIDSHVHMATDPDGVDNRLHTLQVLQQMLYTGVTTVRDMAGDARTLAGLARDARLGNIASPEVYYSALMAGPIFFKDPRTASSTRGGANGAMPYMKAISDTMDCTLAVAEARGSGASGIKLYANLQPEIVRRITAEANKQHIPVWSHAWLQGARPSDLVKAGVISISHAPLLVYETMDSVPRTWKAHRADTAFWDTVLPSMQNLFTVMKKHHTILDATLLTYKKWGTSDSSMQWDYEIGRRIAAKAHKAGVMICAGTDDDQEQFVQDEMDLLVADAGLTPFEALVAATANSAAATGLAAKKGKIKIGMDADLLILTRNPLTTIGNIRSVDCVIKAGRIYQPPISE